MSDDKGQFVFVEEWNAWRAEYALNIYIYVFILYTTDLEI